MKLYELPKDTVIHFIWDTQATFLWVDGMYGKWKDSEWFKIWFLANTEVEDVDGKYFLKK